MVRHPVSGLAWTVTIEIAGADPLLHDFFKFGRGLPVLIHAVSLRAVYSGASAIWRARPLAGWGYAIGGKPPGSTQPLAAILRIDCRPVA
jgi:hypothetical protein